MPELDGKRAVILVAEQHNDYEYSYPYYRLQEAGCAVDLAGAEQGVVYTGKYGMPATADVAFDALRAEDYQAVVIPGGFAPDFIRRSTAATDFVRAMHHAGKTTASICHGGWVAVSAGILRGKRCTSFFAIRDDMANAGGLWEDAETVVDGNLITARKPDDLPAFMRAIIKHMQGER